MSPSYDLECKKTKSAGYSHESMETTRSSKIPYGLIVDMSSISNMVGVILRLASFGFFMVSMVIMFMEAPKSTKTLDIWIYPIHIVTMQLPESSYIASGNFPIINLDKFPTTCTIGGSLRIPY